MLNNLNHIPVFDSLTHITVDGKWFETSHDASFARLKSIFENNIYCKKALLVGLPGNSLTFLQQIAEQNKYLIPIAPFNMEAEADLDSYFNLIKKMGFKGIKIHPRILKINLKDKKIIKIIRAADKYNLVILLCTIHRAPSRPIGEPVSEVIYHICTQINNAKIILMHGGYYDLLATSELIRSFPNVLLDLSTTLMRFQHTHLRETIAFLFETFDKRICIGSDFPEYTVKDVVESVHHNILKNKNINEAKLLNIFYNNLNGFFAAH